ncbi:MAG: hypothetical protein AAF252_05735, partial [Pseudomonadota bacterium]
MKVNSLTLWSVDLTSHATYYMAEGKTCATVKTHVLRLTTDTFSAHDVCSALTFKVHVFLSSSPFAAFPTSRTSR